MLTLFVNGSKRTKINLFGKLSLLTNDTIDKLFDMDIEDKDFTVDNFKFKAFIGPYSSDNNFVFIVSEL